MFVTKQRIFFSSENNYFLSEIYLIHATSFKLHFFSAAILRILKLKLYNRPAKKINNFSIAKTYYLF